MNEEIIAKRPESIFFPLLIVILHFSILYYILVLLYYKVVHVCFKLRTVAIQLSWFVGVVDTYTANCTMVGRFIPDFLTLFESLVFAIPLLKLY